MYIADFPKSCEMASLLSLIIYDLSYIILLSSRSFQVYRQTTTNETTFPKKTKVLTWLCHHTQHTGDFPRDARLSSSPFEAAS